MITYANINVIFLLLGLVPPTVRAVNHAIGVGNAVHMGGAVDLASKSGRGIRANIPKIPNIPVSVSDSHLLVS